MKMLALLGAILAVAPVPALAGDLNLTIRDKSGQPVGSAVVMVYPASGVPAGPIRFPWAYVMGQQNITFDPTVLIVPVGAEVKFPNHDKVRHHVYSFSAGNKFELKLYGQDESRSVSFKTTGTAAIGCNIHDRMAGYIRVVDTPFAIKTGENGQAVLRNLPAGGARVVIYQPYLRAPKNETTVQALIPATGAATLAQTVDIRAPAGAMLMKH
jgi:hypothetical protein